MKIRAYKCDRCGSLYEQDQYDGLPLVEDGNKYTMFCLLTKAPMTEKQYDLCKNCMTSLINWVKNVGKGGKQ